MSEVDFKALTKLDALQTLKKELNKLLLTASTEDSIVSFKIFLSIYRSNCNCTL